MSIRLFMPLIRQRLGELFAGKIISPTISQDEINNLLEEDILIKSRFGKITNPDIYMSCIFEYLSLFGSTSMKFLIEYYIFYYLEPDDDVDLVKLDDLLRKNFYRRLSILKSFRLINLQTLSYTYPKQLTIYSAPFCTEEQMNSTIERYKGYEQGFYERRKKKVEYTYPKKDNSAESIVKDELTKAVKKKVGSRVKALTEDKFSCCAVAWPNDEELDKHWKSKYMISKHDNIAYCRECSKPWSVCEHNCHKTYLSKQSKARRDIEQILNKEQNNQKYLGS